MLISPFLCNLTSGVWIVEGNNQVFSLEKETIIEIHKVYPGICLLINNEKRLITFKQNMQNLGTRICICKMSLFRQRNLCYALALATKGFELIEIAVVIKKILQ